MSIRVARLAVVLGFVAGVVATGAAAQSAQVYRYVDESGRVVYTDREPPPTVKNVERRTLGQNVVESQVPINTQLAQERFPVTLYTFACGELCRNAEALLNRRGIPFTLVNVSLPDGAEKLQRLTGELQAPVLQVGDKLLAKGFNDQVWQGLLSEAGYPKTPPPRRGQMARAPAEAPKADVPKAAAPPTPGSGYPVH